MGIYFVDPIADPRWLDLVERHPCASVFHTRGWLSALRDTYAYVPIAVSTCGPDEELTNALVFCSFRSLLTGNRLVSLPFADHCEPLVTKERDLHELVEAALSRRLRPGSGIELRPRHPSHIYEHPLGAGANQTFWFHELDLRPTLTDLFSRFHRNSVQANIHRATRQGLICVQGRSRELLDIFYQLLLKTRRRHGLPPQPRQWFSNLLAALAYRMTVHVVTHHGQPIAAILALRHRDIMYYKYAVSDGRFHNLGGVQLALWNVIQRAKEDGCQWLDFGRSDVDAAGLLTFKDRWGTTRSVLRYYCYPRQAKPLYIGWKRPAQTLLSHMPSLVLEQTGKLLYRHLG